MLPSDSFLSCLDSLLGYSTGAPGFATDCLRDVEFRGLTIGLLYFGPLFGNYGGFVKLTYWRTIFSLFSIMFYIFLNASQHDNTFFSFTLFSRLKQYFIFFT